MVLLGNSTDKDGENRELVVDYKGDPADKSRTGGWLGAGLILGTEFAERICVNSINMNVVTYLVGDLHLPTAKSATIVTNFNGTLNLLALLGGFLADAKLGRYMTVAIFASVAAVGLSLLTLSTSLPSMKPPPCNMRSQHGNCVEANGGQLAMLFVALYTIALGGGGLKSNVSGFGTDQFDSSDPKEEKAMLFFFSRFYCTISIGSLFAVTILVYIQDHVGRGWGYGISAAAMLSGVIILIAGTRVYRYRYPQGSPLTIIWRVLFLAFQKRKLPHPSDPSQLNGFHTTKIPYTPRLRCLDKAAIVDDFAAKDENWNNPWIVSTVNEVEEIKLVSKLVPIWATCIIFWTIYSQMTTFTVEQATFMNRKLGSFEVPAGTFSVFLFLSILLITSMNEKVTVPIARKLTGNILGFTSLQRIGVGLVSSMMAMISAGFIERYRRDKAINGEIVSAFWLVPQYFFVGAGEGFAYVGQLEFFIREAPEKMKSMSTGFFLSTLAMGFFMSSLLVSIVGKASNDRWLKSNLNAGKLENFYWLLAVLALCNFFLFQVFARKHQYKVQPLVGGEKGEKELENWENGNV